MRGRLNVFQRTMLRFRDLHPYNPVHVVDIDAPLDSARLATAIDDELARRGITHLALDAQRRHFEYAGGPGHAPLRCVDGGSDRFARLAVEIESELNAPFDTRSDSVPMRFFALTAGDRFHLALVYDHFIAGGDAIVALMAAIASRYVDRNATVTPAPPLYPSTYRDLFIRRPVDALRALAALPPLVASSRRGSRPRYSANDDHYNGFLLARLEPAGVDRLAECTKSWGVTRNDLLLAALMLAMAPLAEKRWQASRRRELGVASIVNLRRDFGASSTAFGQFLSSFRVSHMVPPDIDLETLARAVHAQSAAIRRQRLHLRTILALAVAGAQWPFLAPATRHRFFAKHHPVWGAITMLDVNALWPGAAPPDYIRGVPTGPLSPLVVAATPVGNRINLGFAFRTACYSRASIEQIAADVVHRFAPLTS